MLQQTPLIDGHNDLPWEIRERFKGALAAIDLSSDTSKLPLPKELVVVERVAATLRALRPPAERRHRHRSEEEVGCAGCSSSAARCSCCRSPAPPTRRSSRRVFLEIRGQRIENPRNRRTEFTYRLCRSHAYDKAMDDLVKKHKDCTTNFNSPGGGRRTRPRRAARPRASAIGVEGDLHL